MIALAEKPFRPRRPSLHGWSQAQASDLGDVLLGARPERVEAAVESPVPRIWTRRWLYVGPAVEGGGAAAVGAELDDRRAGSERRLAADRRLERDAVRCGEADVLGGRCRLRGAGAGEDEERGEAAAFTLRERHAWPARTIAVNRSLTARMIQVYGISKRRWKKCAIWMSREV